MDLIFGLSIKFWGKVSVGDKKNRVKVLVGDKSGESFGYVINYRGKICRGKISSPLKIFVTFPDIFSPIRYATIESSYYSDVKVWIIEKIVYLHRRH